MPSASTYTIVATNVAGNGVASVPSSDRPAAPTSVTASNAIPSDGTVTVSWLAPTINGGSPIIGYTVSSNSAVCNSVITSCVFPANVLPYGNSMIFSVTASNSAGAGPASSSALFTPLFNGNDTTVVNNGLPLGGIIGIAIGGVVVASIVAIFGGMCLYKRWTSAKDTFDDFEYVPLNHGDFFKYKQ